LFPVAYGRLNGQRAETFSLFFSFFAPRGGPRGRGAEKGARVPIHAKKKIGPQRAI